jgi:transcriptional regulator with XRE-family HTH domain
MMAKRITDEEIAFNVRMGQLIEAARMAKGMTTRSAAEAMGISATQYYWYESGRDRIPLYRLHKLAQELQVRVTELMPVTNASSM